jgi:hypothetical protein
MEYGWNNIPDWFFWFVCIIFILFIGISYWLTRGKVDLPVRRIGDLGTKASYTENPIKVMTQRADICDMKTNYVGYVKRNFDNTLQMLISLVMPNYFVDVSSKDANGDLSIRIHKLREKKDLLQSRWEVKIITKDDEERFMIKSEKKMISNVSLSFPYKNEIINVSKNIRNNTINFYKNGKCISLISYNGKLPPRNIFIDAQEGDLPIPLLASIFEIIKFYK